ncbi:MAG: divalent-cation tolerance protein CutA [Nanoarchaeota archaeon]|nr:divalent-cation tolerance protein CutA [Nanoarchaeota archaeon]MBU1052014.1 divalent-cation tolerance protein CutA [Nanoarchaeota archaeon]MBU1988798.1 divalent-cation tolerance protein CutA [Nanoarchaeota archaeon]
MGFIIIKVTYPNEKEVNDAVSHLLQKKLISSANLFPIKSTSRWTGEIKEVEEFIVLLNTIKENWEKVKSEVAKIHSYKVPCITRIDAEANEEYEDWVNSETK